MIISPAYIHLPGRHEVCTLPDPLKDLLQLGVDEGVVLRERQSEKLSDKLFQALEILCEDV